MTATRRRISKAERAKWRTIQCSSCAGYGVVSDFRGGDFNGAMDCRSCGGKGFHWVSPRDRLADYPGGPFRGWAPGAYAEAKP